MNNKVIGLGVAAVALGVVGVADSAAAGGTGVTNSYTNRVSRGSGRVDFYGYESGTRYRVTNSDSIKAESYGGDVNTAHVYVDGRGNLKGSAYSANRRPVDPVAIISKTSLYESERSNFYNRQSGYEKYNFSETNRSHSVESYSF